MVPMPHVRNQQVVSLLLGVGALSLSAACSGTHRGDGEPMASSSSAVVSCAGGATLEGVDVSEFQGGIDWNAVHGSGRAFAIARVSDGTQHPDPTFDTNWAGIKAAGMVRGVYQFFRASEDPIAQADFLLGKVGTLAPGDLPPVLDVEVTDGQSGDAVIAGVSAWAAHIQQQTGITPMVYTAPGFWDPLPNTGSLGNLVLWVANWQVSCPDTPTPWGSWKFWQYADNGSVPGIAGAVDLDQFNGALVDLQAVAQGGDKAPQGWMDSADCTQIAGWTYDPDTPNQAISVDFYFGGTAGSGAPGIHWTAGVHRPDLCSAIGTCDHGYVLPTPIGLMDNGPHQVFAYGIDSSGNGNNPALQGAPKSFTCPPPKIPYSPAIKRHVANPTVLATWKYNLLTDLAHLADADLNPVAQGSDTPATPVLVTADDGTPEVWVIDGNQRRHVQDPASMDAWHFDWNAIAKTPAAQVYARAKGLDWPEKPFLAQGSGAPVYMIDLTTAGPAGADGGPAAVLDGGPAVGGEDGAGPGASPPSGGGGSSSGGCSASPAPATQGLGWSAMVVFAAAAAARRRARGS
jgi:GH25 family lysozyme M1 (1,4-beta-N-acetylmuramidase)